MQILVLVCGTESMVASRRGLTERVGSTSPFRYWDNTRAENSAAAIVSCPVSDPQILDCPFAAVSACVCVCAQIVYTLLLFHEVSVPSLSDSSQENVIQGNRSRARQHALFQQACAVSNKPTLRQTC